MLLHRLLRNIEFDGDCLTLRVNVTASSLMVEGYIQRPDR